MSTVGDHSGEVLPYSRLQSRLRRAVETVCPPWLESRREDLVQMALLRVLEIQRRSEGDRQFTDAYLWKVAYSALIDEIRRLRRRREVSLDEEAAGTVQGAAGGATPEEDLAASELGAEIRSCLDELAPARRQAVILRLLGHSVPEAAEILDQHPKRIENLTLRGLEDLRRCLTSKGLQP